MTLQYKFPMQYSPTVVQNSTLFSFSIFICMLPYLDLSVVLSSAEYQVFNVTLLVFRFQLSECSACKYPCAVHMTAI
jgi:hypothetical protein